MFQYEPGGHRFQRVPPNDKRGRVQTSSVTVAVLDEPPLTMVNIRPEDLNWVFSRGSGAGGQHRNKTESAVDLTHIPTKVVVHCESERSQQQNKVNALAMLRARLWESQRESQHRARAGVRREQVGVGARGDKSWTVRYQDEIVTYEPTRQKFKLRDYLNGEYKIYSR